MNNKGLQLKQMMDSNGWKYVESYLNNLKEELITDKENLKRNYTRYHTLLDMVEDFKEEIFKD